MSNTYCTLSQLNSLHDARVVAQLSNDANSTTATDSVVQLLLDIEASNLDTVLAGRVSPVPMTSPPALFTKFVAAWTMKALYLRRGDLPDTIKAQCQEADDWVAAFIKGMVGIPNQTRAQPELTSSGSTDGSSRFDNIPGFSPPPRTTGTSKGASWIGGR